VSTELPSELTVTADLRGNEYAWRPQDFPDTLSRAASLGLACLGGQFQFRVPDSTYEMYWREANSGERAEGEKWADYVIRSEREVREGFTRLLETVDFRRDAHDFDHLRQMIADEAFVPLKYLCFVAYFVDERDYKGLTKRSSQPLTGA
jgi:hypothetical protein